MATEAKTKSAVKKAPVEKAVKKAAEPKESKAVRVKKDEANKAPSVSGKVKVTQVVGSIARRADQEATLIGLGLNKRHRSRVLEDTPSVRGMIYKVRHLLKVESAN